MLNGMSPGREMWTASGAGVCVYGDPLCLWEALSHVSDLPGKLLVSHEEWGGRRKSHLKELWENCDLKQRTKSNL